MKDKIKVGQTIYLKPIGHHRRGQEIRAAVIKSIGRKYFTLEEWHLGRYHIDTFFQDGGQYNANYQAYLSLQDIEDQKERYELELKIKNYHSSMTLEQVRQIAKILNIEYGTQVPGAGIGSVQ